MEKILHSPGLMIIIGIILVVGISIVCYYIARFMKGSLKLELKGKSFHSGDQIAGVLTAKVKKNIYADRLYVALIGEREERTRRTSSSGGSSTSKKWVEFYRDEVDVLLDEELQPGFENRYDFVIDTPAAGQVMNGSQAISKTAENMEDGAMKSVVQGVSALASMTGSLGGRKRWKVYARLETKGVDLATSKRIHVSLNSM